MTAAVAAGVVLSAGAAASGPGTVPLSRLVGQTIMSAMAGTTPSQSLLARIRRGEVGGIILFGGNVTSQAQARALTARLQSAARSGGNPPLLIATDQEGGYIRRFPDGPPVESAATMGRESASRVAAIGRATGQYLISAGVDVNLAPVVDVPSSRSSFLGSRTFSGSARVVARLGPAFVTGVQSARVAATAKHFPGLGTASANTDTSNVVVDTSAGELTRRLAPFRAAIAAGVKLVMVSNAVYPALDRARLPASLSPAIVHGLLRGRLGFRGVVITDTLGAPGPRSYADAPLRALKAGVDVLLLDDESSSAAAYEQLLRAARQGALSRTTLAHTNARIATLKAWLARRR